MCFEEYQVGVELMGPSLRKHNKITRKHRVPKRLFFRYWQWFSFEYCLDDVRVIQAAGERVCEPVEADHGEDGVERQWFSLVRPLKELFSNPRLLLVICTCYLVYWILHTRLAKREDWRKWPVQPWRDECRVRAQRPGRFEPRPRCVSAPVPLGRISRPMKAVFLPC